MQVERISADITLKHTSVVMFCHLLISGIENDFLFPMAGDAGF